MSITRKLSRPCTHLWSHRFFYKVFVLYFIISLRKFWPPYLGNSTAAVRAALPSPTSACWVFSCFRNPLNSDMDYRIFNMRTWSFVCVRIHAGVGHTDSESAQHFFTLKNSWRGRGLNPGSLDLELNALPTEPPRHPHPNYHGVTSWLGHLARGCHGDLSVQGQQQQHLLLSASERDALRTQCVS